MEPLSTRNVPATALRSVDFPEPLVPMMIRNELGSNRSETLRSARTSFGVPGLKVLVMLETSSMSGGGRFCWRHRFQLAQKRGRYECNENKCGSDEFKVIRVQPPT